MQTAVTEAFNTFENKTKLCREVTKILFDNQRSPKDPSLSINMLHKMEKRFGDAVNLFDSVDVINSFSYQGSLNRVLCEDFALILVDKFLVSDQMMMTMKKEKKKNALLLPLIIKAEACAVESRKADERKEIATKLRQGIEAVLAEAWSIESDLVVAQSNAAEAERIASAEVAIALEQEEEAYNNNNKRAKH